MKPIYTARLGDYQMISEKQFVIINDHSTDMDGFPSLESAQDALERGRRTIGPISPGMTPQLKYGLWDHVFAFEDGCLVQKSDLPPR